MEKKIIHAWLQSAADEGNYDKYYKCHTRIGLAIKLFYAKLFYDYIEILDSNYQRIQD